MIVIGVLEASLDDFPRAVAPGGTVRLIERYASELVHDVALADLHGEFSTVIDTTTVLAAI